MLENQYIANDNCTFIDLNRAGTPLLEIVSEPELNSAQEQSILEKLAI